jgi:hypothetical protein
MKFAVTFYELKLLMLKASKIFPNVRKVVEIRAPFLQEKRRFP